MLSQNRQHVDREGLMEEPSINTLQGLDIVARMDLPVDLGRLPDDRIEHLCAWIRKKVRKQKQFNRKESSYRMKMHYEEESGYYVTNGQFKGAMLRCGYEPENERMIEWRFKASVRLTSVN